MWLLNDLSLLTSFFFFFLSSLQRTLQQQAPPTPSYDSCAPQLCGNHSVRYPFWISGHQPSFCGGDPLSYFGLTCHNETGTLFSIFFGFDFLVRQIFYSNQSVHLALAGGADEFCRLVVATNATDAHPFALSLSNKRILFLLNCSNPGNRYQDMSCPGFASPALFAGEYVANRTPTNCSFSIVPVLGYSDVSLGSNFTALLTAGWVANWTARSCQTCDETGGRCGYDNGTTSPMPGFICMCPHGVSRRSCQRGIKWWSTRKLIAVAVGSAGFVALACAVIFLFWRWLKTGRSSRPSKLSLKDPDVLMDHFQTHVFSYDELEEATDRFDSSRELGDGGFGTVYKGKLRDGRTVAVKCLYGKNCRSVEQFVNEVKILSLLHHQNLVSLYGSTSHHSPELLLVYEFIPNGTVADHLHGSRAAERILTWPMRLLIAIETADALAYLHAVDPPIIHRDIKTTNILLDNSFHVKIADFGLSRLFPMDATHVSTAPQGTPGYVDPEYHRCYQLSGKSDVYSFGVVLIELISSKPPIDLRRERSDINLANMAIAKIQNHELVDLVDPELWHPNDEVTRMRITMVAELAFRCLQADGDLRPSIKEVLDELIAIEKVTSGKLQAEDAALVQDDASLMQNIVKCSPDTVAGKWVSQSTASDASH
ncbi:LEAF RUST 10 DISEASE-RESISTANCE LOCUS RECEPTOR-LIKE PROTEIN KINASE-like 1.2 [Zingiber officinale]|uniref:LEAF RUST 10 DISEASE-RESISTANCE LOCUS RECEPTOR-LIKE PROTEIN KINASE-like 1.2 n=1 Tax=Zingiber officinale TaxID=94328 RepID=UPI001C4D9F39|nr:LEAF RUST 10 DISEASE-RESISTANCE LOCUS RECEPTOR-LIKE PROTEIN KINASE-like 1.2 [Zingiber officinale]